MAEYAIRYGDTLVLDPSWECIADVLATFHGGVYTDTQGRVTGELLTRSSDTGEWVEVG